MYQPPPTVAGYGCLPPMATCSPPYGRCTERPGTSPYPPQRRHHRRRRLLSVLGAGLRRQFTGGPRRRGCGQIGVRCRRRWRDRGRYWSAPSFVICVARPHMVQVVKYFVPSGDDRNEEHGEVLAGPREGVCGRSVAVRAHDEDGGQPRRPAPNPKQNDSWLLPLSWSSRCRQSIGPGPHPVSDASSTLAQFGEAEWAAGAGRRTLSR